MCPETWKPFNGIPQARDQRVETVLTGHRSGEAALLCLDPAIVIFWQQMGGHWSWLWATGDTRGLIGNRSHTRIHTHLWLLSRVHSRARADQPKCRTSHTQYHTLNYSDSHVNTLQQCVTHTHGHSGAPLCPQRKAPRGERKGVRVLFLMKSM